MTRTSRARIRPLTRICWSWIAGVLVGQVAVELWPRPLITFLSHIFVAADTLDFRGSQSAQSTLAT